MNSWLWIFQAKWAYHKMYFSHFVMEHPREISLSECTIFNSFCWRDSWQWATQFLRHQWVHKIIFTHIPCFWYFHFHTIESFQKKHFTNISITLCVHKQQNLMDWNGSAQLWGMNKFLSLSNHNIMNYWILCSNFSRHYFANLQGSWVLCNVADI